jgi:hypothetical protein
MGQNKIKVERKSRKTQNFDDAKCFKTHAPDQGDIPLTHLPPTHSVFRQLHLIQFAHPSAQHQIQ